MNWILLFTAGIIELGFTFSLGKVSKTAGSERLIWMVVMVVTIVTSLYLVSRATQTIPLGTAYAVWTGMGAVGTVLIGIIFFKEPASFARLFFIFMLICSIIGLKVVSN